MAAVSDTTNSLTDPIILRELECYTKPNTLISILNENYALKCFLENECNCILNINYLEKRDLDSLQRILILAIFGHRSPSS